jgi:urease accessory protein
VIDMKHAKPTCTYRPRGALAILALLAAPLAQAHHPMGGATPSTMVEGLLSGLGHPVIGPDHLAFLLIAGLLAAAVAGSARYLLPLAFVGATVGGTLYHLAAADLPLTESVIALSVLLGGLALVLRRNLPTLLLGGLFAVAGVYHGYAYGEAIIGAESTPLLAYLAGFAFIQYLLIAATAWGMARLAAGAQAGFLRGAGIVATAAGGLFLALSLA